MATNPLRAHLFHCLQTPPETHPPQACRVVFVEKTMQYFGAISSRCVFVIEGQSSLDSRKPVGSEGMEYRAEKRMCLQKPVRGSLSSTYNLLMAVYCLLVASRTNKSDIYVHLHLIHHKHVCILNIQDRLPISTLNSLKGSFQSLQTLQPLLSALACSHGSTSAFELASSSSRRTACSRSCPQPFLFPSSSSPSPLADSSIGRGAR
jgi:hypothetical protein